MFTANYAKEKFLFQFKGKPHASLKTKCVTKLVKKQRLL